jgi:hypothetical protein
MLVWFETHIFINVMCVAFIGSNMNVMSMLFSMGAQRISTLIFPKRESLRTSPGLIKLVMGSKNIGDVIKKDNRYHDAPNDLVPQIVGLRFLSSPQNLLPALLSAPCLSDIFCSIQQSPHTLPYKWNGLQKEGK